MLELAAPRGESVQPNMNDAPTPAPSVRDTHARALAINLDPSIFGSFAEIGGGQEVSRWFLSVGAASGTVAQTISAYDKAFSDKTYGAGTRYVSRERLAAMLEHEYAQLLERLGPTRGDQSRFFAFANTVATRNFKGNNDQHGWVGLRFQTDPHSVPSGILLHVNFLDRTAALQQDALGVLGVNLIYSVHHARTSAETFLNSLWNGLSGDRLEIDVLDFSGPAFTSHDARAWCLQLLRREMAHMIVFDQSFRAVEPASVLRKRPLLVDLGRFETLEPHHADMLSAAKRALHGEGAVLSGEPQAVLEIALRSAIGHDEPDDAQMLARISQMLTLTPAVVTNLTEAYRLIPYFRRHTAEPIRLVGGATLIARVLQAQFYEGLPGSLMEGLGKLFASNVKFYVYPMPRDAVVQALGGGIRAGLVRVAESQAECVGADDLILTPPSDHLYRYLRDAGQVLPIAAV